jgi:hypothetical protein
MMDTTTAGAKTRKRAPLRRKDESAIRYCLSLDYFYVLPTRRGRGVGANHAGY